MLARGFYGVPAKRGHLVQAIPLFGSRENLPSVLAGLALESADPYPDPNLGAIIRYGIPPVVKADAYLYDLGMPSISDDLRSPQVIEFFRESLHSVSAAADQGLYLDFEMLGSGYLRIPEDALEPFCLCASFAYRQNSQAPVPPTGIPGKGGVINDVGRVASHMALRTDRGYINKVRFNYPESLGERGFGGFLRFLTEWTHLVQTVGQ